MYVLNNYASELNSKLWFVKIRAFFLVFTIVSILVYYTPYPDLDVSEEESCDRNCHPTEWSRICRLKLELSEKKIIQEKCEKCDGDKYCYRRECVKNVITVNNQIPGPAFHVCVNDVLLVDVVNKLPGRTVALHWRGQSQRETPTMDGVPMVTQCPILPHTIFQYKFRVTEAGTHMWHVHAEDESDDLMYGALVVRKPNRQEPLKDFYDFDDSLNFVLLRFVNQNLVKLVISNQQANIDDFDTDRMVRYTVRKGRRERFRIIHAGGVIKCKINGQIEDHRILIISLDGNPINPFYTSSFDISQGERIDFVLESNGSDVEYDMKFMSNCNTHGLQAKAKIVYDTDESKESLLVTKRPQLHYIKHFTTSLDGDCGDKRVKCLEQVSSFSKLPKLLSSEIPDERLYLAFHTKIQYLNELKGYVNNISFVYPSSPLISQYNEVKSNTRKCDLTDMCTNIINIKLNSLVELILVNQDNTETSEVFHLHGNQFYVIARTQLSENRSMDDVKKLDSNNLLLKRNFQSPVKKDTIELPKFGVTAIRFYADNPGYWLLHGLNSEGMMVVLNVGQQQHLPVLPENFPKCGNFQGPKFFLA